MADDWQVGDLALCVKLDPWITSATKRLMSGPKPGSIHRVSWVGLSGLGNLCLEFEGIEVPRNSNGKPIPWRAIRFRKIHPLSDEERASFMADLNEPVRLPKREPATMTFGVK